MGMGLKQIIMVPPNIEYSDWGGQDEDRFIPVINNQTDSFMGRIIAHFSQVNDHHAFRRNMLYISITWRDWEGTVFCHYRNKN